MKKRFITTLCVAIAGLIFIPAVFLNKPLVALIGAFFDWLPLPAGWMKTEKESNQLFLRLHIIATVTAYLMFVAWIIKGIATLGLAFLEIWWMAVIFGVLMNR